MGLFDGSESLARTSTTPEPTASNASSVATGGGSANGTGLGRVVEVGSVAAAAGSVVGTGSPVAGAVGSADRPGDVVGSAALPVSPPPAAGGASAFGCNEPAGWSAVPAV